MPWSPRQHRYFCANQHKNPQFAKMCREGIKADGKKTDWTKEAKKEGRR